MLFVMGWVVFLLFDLKGVVVNKVLDLVAKCKKNGGMAKSKAKATDEYNGEYDDEYDDDFAMNGFEEFEAQGLELHGWDAELAGAATAKTAANARAVGAWISLRFLPI